MNATIAAELQEWKAIFKEELLSQLETLRADNDVYGFAVEVPDDLGNLVIITAIGRESQLIGEKPGSLVWLDRRYTPVEWRGYEPNASGRSCERLEEIGRRYGAVFSDDSCEDTPEGVEFRDALYSTCLDVMAECDAEGAFGHIWYKIICLSDDDHPIVRESFHRLNRGRSLEEAARLYVDE